MIHDASVNRSRIPLFAAGAMAGFINVTLPASATVFLNPQVFGFSNAMYGGLFVFCFSAAVMASWFFRQLASRFSTERVFLFGVSLYAVGSLLLGVSLALASHRLIAYAITCFSVTLIGIGFGATLSSLNELIVRHSSHRPDVSLAYLHAVVTCGAALAPAAVGYCIDLQHWAYAPIGTGSAMLIVLVSARQTVVKNTTSSVSIANETQSQSHKLIPTEILFLLLVGLYGLCEAAVANWSTVILQTQYAMVESHATVVMSLFWGGVAIFRLLFALFAGKSHLRLLWFLSPIVTCISLAIVGLATDVVLVVLAVALAGIAMSYYFPLTLAIAGLALPESRNRLSGTTVATLLSGAGISAISIGLLSDLHVAAMSTIVGGFGIFALAMIIVQLRIGRMR
jgi:MFS transporter, FHS family, glucose/mannose:H+ symporter